MPCSTETSKALWENMPVLSINQHIDQVMLKIRNGRAEMLTDNGGETLDKVRDAIMRAGYDREIAVDIIREIQNAGILFRERL